MNIFKKIFPFLVILVLLIIIRNNTVSILASRNNTNTASNLEKKLATEKKKNQYLNERLYYVKTDNFVEEEAQEKLGLLRPGEYFVIAPTPSLLDNEIVTV